MPIPTPALAAIWRIGASTPEVTKTSAAAASSVCWLRCASARLVRAGVFPAGFSVDIRHSSGAVDKTEQRSGY
nr:hypothetical protein [Streptomyces chartreusis]